jgi:Arc/MetJ family transcription regulator
MMTTSLTIDPDLLQNAMTVSGVKTATDAVALALTELIQQRKRRPIIATGAAQGESASATAHPLSRQLLGIAKGFDLTLDDIRKERLAKI